MNKIRFFNINIFLLLIALSGELMANTLTELYHGQMPVNDQSTSSRNKAIKVLFEQTLIKVSGKSNIADYPEMKSTIKSALSYASEFSFNNVKGVTYLDVQFSESLIDQLLRNNGITLWDVRRPTAMLWLVYEDDKGQRQLINSQLKDELFVTAKKIANDRGIPLLLPLWDLDDQLEVSITDLWGQFESKVANANARYVSDYMILAKVSSQGFGQQVSWNIYKMSSVVDAFGQTLSEIKIAGNDETETVEEAVYEIINQSTDYFVSQYSVDTSKEVGELFITLNNIDSLQTYVDVVKYLKSIKAVDQLTMVNNKGQEYQFKVKLIGNKQSMIDAISLGNKMIKLTNYDPDLILFQWRG